MVNTLIHADYSDRASVLVIKQPSGFVFRNPGLLRVPAALALQGGASDCRNRGLQQMFLMLGLGERAGSGMAKIQQGWKETGGTLRLVDSLEPFDQTQLEMEFAKTLGERLGETPGEMQGKTPGKTPAEVLALLKANPEAAIPEVAKYLGKSVSAIERAIRRLKSEGKLARIGSTKAGRWQVPSGDEQP